MANVAYHSGATAKMITDGNWGETLAEGSALVGTVAHVTERFRTMALDGSFWKLSIN